MSKVIFLNSFINKVDILFALYSYFVIFDLYLIIDINPTNYTT